MWGRQGNGTTSLARGVWRVAGADRSSLAGWCQLHPRTAACAQTGGTDTPATRSCQSKDTSAPILSFVCAAACQRCWQAVLLCCVCAVRARARAWRSLCQSLNTVAGLAQVWRQQQRHAAVWPCVCVASSVRCDGCWWTRGELVATKLQRKHVDTSALSSISATHHTSGRRTAQHNAVHSSQTAAAKFDLLSTAQHSTAAADGDGAGRGQHTATDTAVAHLDGLHRHQCLPAATPPSALAACLLPPCCRFALPEPRSTRDDTHTHTHTAQVMYRGRTHTCACVRACCARHRGAHHTAHSTQHTAHSTAQQPASTQSQKERRRLHAGVCPTSYSPDA
jgi:hypothetical protein